MTESSRTRSRVTLSPDAIAFEPGVVPPAEQTYGAEFSTDGVLGEGGMGKVLSARDRKLGRRVAIKELRADARSRVDLWGRFVREAQIGGQLEHPNIVPIYGFELSPSGGPAFVMQLVEGESLATYMGHALGPSGPRRTDRPVPTQKDRISKLVPVCDAIAYAHGRGVLHRDLKPDNVMLGAHNVVLVTDWGIARVEADDDSTDIGERVTVVPSAQAAREVLAAARANVSSVAPTLAVDSGEVMVTARTVAAEGTTAETPAQTSSGPVLTALGTVMGTPQYMSPEQAIGIRIGPASDQYALGLMLLELATLRTARSHEDASVAYGQAILGEQCEHVDVDGDHLDPRLSAIIGRATAKAPKDRYENVDALAADIRAYLRDEEVRALPDSLARKLTRHVQAHPGRAVATIAAVVLGLLLWALLGSVRAAERAAWAKKDAESLSQLTAAVLEDAEGVQRFLTGLEAELVGLAHTARVRLETERPPGALTIDLTTPDDLREGRVQGLVRDPVDGILRSFREPVFLFLPGATAESKEQSQRLAAGRTDLVQLYLAELDERALLRSTAEQEALMAAEHDGFVRLMVVLESGLFMQFPGRGDFRPDYDPRRAAWYPATLDSAGTDVSRPKFGPLGRIPRIALSHRVTAYGEVVGAVNGAIWLSALTNLLGRQQAPGLEEPLIAGADGRIIASRALLEQVKRNPGVPEQAIDLPRVQSSRLAAALAKQRGHDYLVDGEALYVLAKLGIEDWQLVHRYPRAKYLKLVR